MKRHFLASQRHGQALPPIPSNLLIAILLFLIIYGFGSLVLDLIYLFRYIPLPFITGTS